MNSLRYVYARIHVMYARSARIMHRKAIGGQYRVEMTFFLCL